MSGTISEPFRLMRTSEPPGTADEEGEVRGSEKPHGAEWLHQQLHADMKSHLEDDADKQNSVYDTVGRCAPVSTAPHAPPDVEPLPACTPW